MPIGRLLDRFPVDAEFGDEEAHLFQGKRGPEGIAEELSLAGVAIGRILIHERVHSFV